MNQTPKRPTFEQIADAFGDPPSTVLATREPLPKDSPGNRWARDWSGRPVNLWGMRKGEDGR